MAWRRVVNTAAAGKWGGHPRRQTLPQLSMPLQIVDSRPRGSFRSSSLPGHLDRAGSPTSLFRRSSEVHEFCTLKACRNLSSQAWVDPPAGTVVDLPLAQTGEGIAECELLKWFVNEGENVEEFQRLCEVQSDKASIEITSRYKGKIQQILFAPGDIVKVGETLLRIFVEERENSVPDLQGLNCANNAISCEHDPKPSLSSDESMRGVLSTPAVRLLAKEYGVNINDIKGTGKDGRVLREDVLNYSAIMSTESSDGLSGGAEELSVLEERKTTLAGSTGQWSFEDRKMQLRGFQRSMVKSMAMSAKVPHFHLLEEVNFDALIKLKAAFQDENTDPNVKHTYLPFLIKSLSLALDRYPLLNSSLNEELNEVILKGSHNIGVAMATPSGLVVPNIKKVQSRSILEITSELSRLQQMAIGNKLNSDDISGGTITLSNIGSIGGKFGCPLLNLPEVAIFAIGRIQKLPRFKEDGTVYPAPIANVVIGADHRVVDGATAARFCKEWKLLIEKPELLLLHMR